MPSPKDFLPLLSTTSQFSRTHLHSCACSLPARESRINFLAHLFLAGPTDASRVGNLLGDFVKGTPASLRDQYPDDVLHGIMMHRHLDRFTDDHPAFRSARDLLDPERRRFAGIIIDVLFDHFLALHWQKFSNEDLVKFIDEMYATLTRHPEWLTPDLARILPHMREENWLHSYSTLPGLELTFHRISRRSPRTAAIAGSVSDLTLHYQSFDREFQRFFPDTISESNKLLKKSLLPWKS